MNNNKMIWQNDSSKLTDNINTYLGICHWRVISGNNYYLLEEANERDGLDQLIWNKKSVVPAWVNLLIKDYIDLKGKSCQTK